MIARVKYLPTCITSCWNQSFRSLGSLQILPLTKHLWGSSSSIRQSPIKRLRLLARNNARWIPFAPPPNIYLAALWHSAICLVHSQTKITACAMQAFSSPSILTMNNCLLGLLPSVIFTAQWLEFRLKALYTSYFLNGLVLNFTTHLPNTFPSCSCFLASTKIQTILTT